MPIPNKKITRVLSDAVYASSATGSIGILAENRLMMC